MKKGHLYRYLQDEKVRFVLAGGWNTVVGCVVFAVLHFLLAEKIHYLVIAVLSHLISVFNAWFTHRTFVFKSSAEMLPEYLRFNLSMLLTLLFQVGALWLAVGILGLHPILSQTCIVVLAAALSYVIHSNFSFQKNRVEN
jgi:putative flippase GtrA